MVMQVDLPPDALLTRFKREHGHYTDCFIADVVNEVALPEFVQAFYTTPLFRLERLILRIVLRANATDADAFAVADGSRDTFAAWSVEDRAENELLLCDHAERTRSWFKVAREGNGTRLHFGSAVIATNGKLSRAVEWFMPVHQFYARSLLKAAVRRLNRN